MTPPANPMENTGMDKPLYAAIEDAIWLALDSEQAMPHSGVDADFVVPEFLRLLDESGYTVSPIRDR